MVRWQQAQYPLSSNNPLAVVRSLTSPRLASMPLQGSVRSGPAGGCPWEAPLCEGTGCGPVEPSATGGPGCFHSSPTSSAADAPRSHPHTLPCGCQDRKGAPLFHLLMGCTVRRNLSVSTHSEDKPSCRVLPGFLGVLFLDVSFPLNSLTCGVWDCPVSGHTAQHCLMINQEKRLQSGCQTEE